MTPERWAQIRQTFDGALERAPKDRAAYLRVVCAGDDELRREVETLLASHDTAGDFLAEPAANISRTLLYSDEEGEDYPENYRVGPYQLQRRIGRGGMGSVWVAARFDHEYEKKVAIKMVKRGMDTQEILRRFRMERQVLANLDHPNIARLIDGGSTPEGLPYLVMEYVEGTPIDQFCESRQSAITERLRLFRAVCSAVQYAHQNLVVHRDIKASNILVTAQGVPKLLDFGIAKLLRSDFSKLDMTQTRPGLRPMTLDYASPEQVRGESITTATDVYLLGVLLYKLLTGTTPYGPPERLPDAIQRAICETEPRRPSAVILSGSEAAIPQATLKLEAVEETRDKARKRLRKKLAGDLDMIILKALRKEPLQRYASVEQFSEDIRRYMEGLPVIARSGTIGYRTAKFIRRNAAGLAAAALIGIALAGAAIVSFSYARFATRERVLAERRFDATRTALQRELMQAHLRLAEQQANAGENYRAAFNLAQAVYRAHPEQAESRRDLAHAAEKLGDLLGSGTGRGEALQRYGDALAQYEALAAMDSHDLGAQQDVMVVASKAGAIQFQTGDLLAALASYSRSLQIAEGLETIEAARGNSRSPETQRAVASGNAHVGEVLARNGARDAALAKLRKALGIYQELFDANRENAGTRDALISLHRTMGDVLSAGDRFPEAANSYRRALALLPAESGADQRQELKAKLASLGK